MPSRSDPPPSPSAALPVLLVDDVALIVEVVRAVLGQLGFRDVDAAADGTVALVRMRERRYGLVIADWNMLPMTGYELLRRVRADPDLRRTPFVMMTTQEQAECFPAARRAGVNACLVKPFMPAALRETIRAVCGTGPADGTSVLPAHGMADAPDPRVVRL